MAACRGQICLGREASLQIYSSISDDGMTAVLLVFLVCLEFVSCALCPLGVLQECLPVSADSVS